jgi:mannose-6-phosphate isomerase-like protein (cupin superfamily)
VTMRNGEIRTDALVEECCTIPKGWGREIIIENNEMYCGKILEFKKGCKFSMHFHMEKDETWWVEKGNFYYSFIDTETALKQSMTISPGWVVRQYPGQPHQLEALTDGKIFEVSTHHKDSDSYRVSPGDSQKEVYDKLKKEDFLL